MTTSFEDYAEYVDTLLAGLKGTMAMDKKPDINMCILGLEPGGEHAKVRDYCIETLKYRAADFDRALRTASIKQKLGGLYPESPRHFVQMMADQLRLSVTYKGLMTKNERPYLLRPDGTKETIPCHLAEGELHALVRAKFQGHLTFDDWALYARTQAVETGLSYDAKTLNDASKVWFNTACADRLWRIEDDIATTDGFRTPSSHFRQLAQGELRKLAETCFETPHGADFVAAVFNKFIWQVKRKIRGLPVFDHLMPIILGQQGIGKSTLIRMMLKVVEELTVTSDFKMITDERNISLWKNFVIFMDEMGWAKAAEMAVVKGVVTAETLNRRIFHTTVSQEVKQNATFIGAANAGELADILRDDTGNPPLHRAGDERPAEPRDRQCDQLAIDLAVGQRSRRRPNEPVQSHPEPGASRRSYQNTCRGMAGRADTEFAGPRQRQRERTSHHGLAHRVYAIREGSLSLAPWHHIASLQQGIEATCRQADLQAALYRTEQHEHLLLEVNGENGAIHRCQNLLLSNKPRSLWVSHGVME
jgi:hypothetical protein